MVSHADYVKDKDKAQLENLIEVAQKRLNKIKSKGQVRIFGVFKSHSNVGWFGSRPEAEAAFLKAAQDIAGEKYPEVSISPEMVPVEELAEYMGAEAAAAFLATEPKIHPLPFK